MKNQLIVLFFILGVANILAVAIQWQPGIYITKPLLMTVLAIWFYLNTKNKFGIFAKYILSGILFSIAGDVLLMFVYQKPYFFLLGLGSFFITHLFYIFAFARYERFESGMLFSKKWLLAPVVVYIVLFDLFLLPDLPEGLMWPVLLYGIVIATMLLATINMKGRVGDGLANGLIWGALLFVLSDSVIAINKFKQFPLSENMAGVAIMITYLSGQYLIVKNAWQINRFTPPAVN